MSPEMPIPSRGDVGRAAVGDGVSEAAVALVGRSDFIDLHLDSFIPARLWGYDLLKRHEPGLLRGRFFGHLDFPRALEAGLTGGMWSITTNPARLPTARWQQFLSNLERLRGLVEATEGRFRMVRTASEYAQARREGCHGVMVAIQGGNALEGAPSGVASVPERMVTRVTLVHLTSSVYGETSSPLRLLHRQRGLTGAGCDMVRQLNEARVFVDLAHIHEAGFWKAVAVHDRSQPLIVTHTGVTGVRPHWRNIDDRQIKAIADTGGTIGVIFAAPFLRRRGGPDGVEMILEHMAHIIRVAGEDFVSVGSDFDGAIVPPAGMRDGALVPRLVQGMLDRGWREERIQKVLGRNFLRSLSLLRP